MPNLDCIVTNCIYNDNKCCCKGDIKVKGKSAQRTEETCCGSFVEQKDGARNAAGEPSKQIDVACEACKCKFNEDCKCTADHIGIAGKNACSCKETECASFCCCD